MKKFFASILMLLYISASGGVVLNVHYCMGEIASIEIDHFSEADDCEKCGMPEDSNSCCRSEFKVVKFNNVHKATAAISSTEIPVAILPASISLIDASKLVSNKIDHQLIYRPPIKFPDLNVLNCTFRI